VNTNLKQKQQLVLLFELFAMIFSLGILISDGRSLYLWNDKLLYWQRIKRSEMQRVIRSLVDEEQLPYISTAVINEVVNMLINDPRLYRDFDATRKSNQHLIHVRNGVFDTKTSELITDEKFIRSCNFDYCMDFEFLEDFDAEDTPTWNKLLETSLQAESDSDKEQYVYEVLAYLLCRYTKAERAVVLYGDSGSGKSLLCNLVEGAFEARDVIAFMPTALGNKNERFKFRDILLAVNREVPMSQIGQTDVLKSLITCEMITGEEKYQMSESFVPRCKLLMAGNTLPNFKEVDDTGNESLIRRLLVLPFKRVHDMAEADLDMKDKLIGEKNYIFSRALKYLPSLVERNFVFTECADIKDVLANYAELQDLLPSFVKDCCEIGEGLKVHNKDILIAVRNYYRDNGMICQMNDNQIINRLIKLSGAVRGKFRLNGPPLSGLKNICLK